MAHETVLIIEDDSTLLRGLKDNFEFAGYQVETPGVISSGGTTYGISRSTLSVEQPTTPAPAPLTPRTLRNSRLFSPSLIDLVPESIVAY